MQNRERRILLLVEGEKTEINLFERILECFPEIQVEKHNIFYYGTSLWNLNKDLIKEFGDEWYNEKIDFVGFLKSITKVQEQVLTLQQTREDSDVVFTDLSFTDVFIIFDYERQDRFFDAGIISKMQSFWNESTENGLLYINYPMIEAYRHIKKPLPDEEYLDRKCDCAVLFNKESERNKYKQISANESSFTNLSKITKDVFRELVIHNLCKASAITGGNSEISEREAKSYWDNKDMIKILNLQNECSRNERDGFAYVLATCLFFIPEYNSKLVFLDDNHNGV